ncbi:MAG: cytochrome c oxidase subunit 3 [Flavobacterium sp.]|jgi:cytochrome c oxidase subunit 3|uniref:cytochrome c oxidase subunit 3 n=1 Tax=Flavobacterium sp. TaxID=239 RepID=UPI002B4719E5|nr:cytochrome c oxidase subunit 3 [Flavobacterium sp.]WRH74491.1 MAG: cytochrome c oxidase subunit 3 [Flavobacterium sp.]
MENRMTLEEEQARKGKTYKMLLWFGMISICMIFAGLTSGFIVSKKRPDWVADFGMPKSLILSTIIILISSFTFHLAKKYIKEGMNSRGMFFLISTLVLGCLFIAFQFNGFSELFSMQLVPTGPSSTVSVSFLYAFVIVHVAHLFGGIISLFVVIYNHYKQRYNPAQTLGIELSAMYWHFMDFIWVYLFLFFYFFK